MIQTFRVSNSTLTRVDITAATLDEATLKTGHGVYSVFRTYRNGDDRLSVLRLDRHLDRMRRSAAAVDLPFPHSNDDLRAALRLAVAAAGIALPRIRITVPYDAPDDILVMLEPFSPPPPEAYNDGVTVSLVSAHRDNPQVKDSRFIEVRQKLQQAAAGAYEVVLVDEDERILEGSGSNLYFVLDGELRTPQVGMLEGIARSIVLEVAPPILPVRLETIHLDDLPSVSEAFLTSSSRGIVPIVRMGDQPIGEGRPGPLTKRLMDAYNACIAAELEPL